jgi:hypothetical protein
MVHPCRIAYKSTGRQPIGQMAPRDVPPQPEPQLDSPQYVPQEEDSFEIMVMVPTREEGQEATEEAQQLPQNNENNDNHDNGNNDDEEEEDHKDDEEEEGNEDEYKYDEDYTPLSDSKKEKMYYDIDEIKTARNEATIPTGRLRDLLNHIDITTLPEFRIKRVMCPG